MEPGTLLADRFELVELARAHGETRLYRARDRETGDVVAVKLLSTISKRVAERFERESELLAGLRHPGIVRYVASGALGDGAHYLAMEWVAGETLLERLDRGPLGMDEALSLARGVAEALAYGHDLGVVHRDVKPSNVVLVHGDAATPKLLDFGVARWVARGPLTHDGMLVGTPGYMAPEQARGDPVDARADVFALGCVLFECLTGLAAFAASTLAAVLMKILFDDPPRLSERLDEVPPGLDDLVSSMLEKDAERRPPSARAVLERLHRVGRGEARRRASSTKIRRASLTSDERRLVSLVVVGSAAGELPDLDSTAVREDTSAEDAPMVAAAERASAALVSLVDGTRVAVLASHGDPVEHVARAARCALELRGLAGERAVALGTGLAELETRLPLGRVVDRVTALAVKRTPGVAIDDVTAGFLGAAFDVHGDGAGPPILRGERTEAELARTAAGKRTPFVGRERELRILLSVWDAATVDETACAVLCVGGPGVGKTRLRYELADALREKGPTEVSGPAVWLARGDSLATTSPFSLAADLIRRAAAQSRGGDADAERAALDAFLAPLPLADRARTTAFVGALSGLHRDEEPAQVKTARRDPVSLSQHVRSALEDVVRARTELGPLLIVLEDLHLGDRPSAIAFDEILDRLRDRPLVVLGLARPEIDAAHPDLWANRALTRIVVRPLGTRPATKLAEALLGDAAAPERIARIVEAAEGNPFFLEELARADGLGPQSALPPTLVALVQQRLETLDPALRRVLRAASIFGGAAWTSAIAHLVGDAPENVAVAIDELARRELLVPRARSRFAGEREVAFRQALVREAAYLLCTDDDRALGHGLAADWLERAGEPDPRILAEHLARAGATVDAANAFRHAAERALEAADLEGALDAVNRGLELRPPPALEGSLLVQQAEVLLWRGDNAAAVTAGEGALAKLAPGSREHYLAARWLAGAAIGLADVRSVVETAERVLVSTPDEDAREQRVIALARIATHLFLLARADLAERLLSAIHEDAERLGERDPSIAAPIHEARARGCFVTGDGEGYARELAAAHDVAERAGDRRTAVNAAASLGFALCRLGRDEEAAHMLRQAVNDSDAMGLAGPSAVARHNLSQALARLGHLEEALAVGRRAIDDLSRLRSPRVEGVSHAYVSAIHLARGEIDDAMRSAERAAEMLAGMPLLAPLGHASLARATLAKGEPERALEHASAAREALLAAGRAEDGEALARLVYVEALSACGRTSEAAAALDEARGFVVEHATRIIDPETRRRFEAIPEHALILRGL